MTKAGASEEIRHRLRGAEETLTSAAGQLAGWEDAAASRIRPDVDDVATNLAAITRHATDLDEHVDAANRLIDQGRIHPLLQATYPLEQVGEAALAVHRNEAEGKLAVLCHAPTEGLGIDDPEKRERVGEANLTRFRTP